MTEFTERDWLTSTDAHAMLGFLFPLHGLHSTPEQPRKLRLYYAALVRQRFELLPAVAEACVNFVEDWADGRPGTAGLADSVSCVAESLALSSGPGCQAKVFDCEQQLRAMGLVWSKAWRSVPVGWCEAETSRTVGWGLVLPFQTQIPAASQLRRADHNCEFLRDVFGNPFQAPTLTGLHSEQAISIARKCYEDRDFRAMPLLADALQDEGAIDDHPAIRHCREEPTHTHTRGCWVVDLLLGR